MIIKAQDKYSTVNQPKHFLVSRLRLQSAAHVCPRVTVLGGQNPDWKVGGRGGVFYNALQVLVNGSCWYYVA